MRHLQLLFCGVALVAALVALAQHTGLDLWGCASCSAVKTLPMSGVLAWSGPVVLGALIYGLAKETKWAPKALVGVACCSLLLALWMIANRTVCVTCVIVHIGTLAAALTLAPKSSAIAPCFFAVAIVFTATGGWDRFTAVQGVGIFRPRPGEEIPAGKVYVLFTDPECSRCRLAEKAIEKLESKPTVLRRWCILPQSAYRSLRAAAMVEMATISKSSKAGALATALGDAVPPLTDDVLLSAARKVGLGPEAAGWLANPLEDALISIQSDQDMAKELQIESLPALAELMPPDATGLRTLRRVPFSSIGVGP